ncbi:pleckstrin homology domain-containing family G member 1 isoform X1 [Sarcophilus harrisii]|uniref:Pleckstrin homology and RhoGEF domain containing G1 n=2 Tax=Sarcophilus harrisii TaxID=9305 RepID=G3W6T0_SARHA|nr:pleckstrin homology domain-containing family G member 1 isoform X1 [Sarcophilus harrisii]
MLSVTMVEILVRGWKNRNSLGKTKRKMVTSQLQDRSQIWDEYQLPFQASPAVTEVTVSKADFRQEKRHFSYRGPKTMELSDSDRPVSFSSTSSSASSRDSHCSFGSRLTLASNGHLSLCNNQDKETGAIKLELMPTRRFSSSEVRRNPPEEKQNMEESTEKWQGVLRTTEAKGASNNGTLSLVAESTTSPKLLYVDRVVQEILETERTYVQDLKSIVKDYLDCIKDQSKLSLGAEERSALFGNIQDIYHFNSGLLQDLENCENDPVAIAECFVSKSEDFHIYTQYCTNYPRSVAVLTECMRNKMVAKFFRERQETLHHSLPLGSYLLKPVQRILKYHLLLHEIENHLDKETDGYDVVLEAIDTMQRVAWHINDMKRKHEHAIRLQEIQSLLTNWKGPDLTSYGELVLEGTFRIQRAKNERTLFLFDKLLLITKKREETFTYKAHILCGNLMLVEMIPKEPLSFSVFHYKNPKLQHTVQAKSQQDKRLWILHLKRLILENHAAKIPAKAKQAILEMDAIHHPGFYYSPEKEMKAFSNSKESTAPHRLRRKSEPSSRIHKVLKSSETTQDMQKISKDDEASSSSLITDLPRSTSAGNPPTQRTSQQNNPVILNVLGGGNAGVRNIWTDHQIRQALFPSRRSPQENEEDEDDYHMFLPSLSSSDLHSTRLCEENGSSRPCSWHLGQMQSRDPGTTNAGHRIVRRASSAGESNTCLPEARNRDSEHVQQASRREVERGSRIESDGKAYFDTELPLSDIDHVYDNISYEDLKRMGFIKRDDPEYIPQRSNMDSLQGVHHQSSPNLLASPQKQEGQDNIIVPEKRDGNLCSKDASKLSSQELNITEENIYDTIQLPDPPLLDFKCNYLKCAKRSSFLGLETDFVCCDSLRPFVSEESLQFSEDETPYRHGPLENDYLSLLYSSSNSDSLSHKSVADKLSEEVDEIWNDLENYIKKNEEKTRDRLLAAFPVSKDDVQERLHAGSTPELSKDVDYAISTLSLPENPVFLKPVKNKAMRLSRTNLPFEEDVLYKENSLMNLNRLSLASEMPSLESPCESINSSLSHTDPESTDLRGNSTDKTKSKVFLMARQYSQKIKRANQLLKVKGPEGEQTTSQPHKSRHKDLAAILEEKKQGGPAIGARIAEYSQLYDQIVFRGTPLKTKKEGWASPGESPILRSSSPPPPSLSQSQCDGECSQEEDWLFHSTYSNGELADFRSWSHEDNKSRYSSSEMNAKSTPRQLPTACSVPSLQTSTPLQDPLQRRSVVINQPNKENLRHIHIYNSLGRKGMSNKFQSYSWSQSTSSIVLNKLVDSINYPNEIGKKQQLSSHRSTRCDSQQDLLAGTTISGQQNTEKCSDMTLQDSQKVLVVNKNLPLNAQIATQNYFSNFKEVEGDEDDYVEIKSEEDESDLEIIQNRTRKSDPKTRDVELSDDHHSNITSYSLSSPCASSTKPVNSKLNLSPYLTYGDSDKLNDYLWSNSSPNQQNIVQALREKFQCLSSSSFA